MGKHNKGKVIKKYYNPLTPLEVFFNELNSFLRVYGLKFSYEDYCNFIKNKNEYYTTFTIKKKNGGLRRIDSPNRLLKHIHRYILFKHLYNFKAHPSATGFIRGRSIFDNANYHVNKNHVYKLDLVDFFPSITKDMVFNVFISKGYNSEISTVMSELCTLNNVLPQGAPTSPAISNLVCYRLDTRLSSLAKKCKLSYTRYADDITFSGWYIKKGVTKLIEKIITDEGFKVSKEKTKLIKNKKNFRQVVTGVVVVEILIQYLVVSLILVVVQSEGIFQLILPSLSKFEVLSLKLLSLIVNSVQPEVP